MRLLANIPHPLLKISIFTNDNRFTLKFESGLYEQTYKFRDGDGYDSVDAIIQLISFCVASLTIVAHQYKTGL